MVNGVLGVPGRCALKNATGAENAVSDSVAILPLDLVEKFAGGNIL